MAYRTLGNTVVEWDDDAPFIFTMREESGPENARVIHSFPIDLTPLRASYEDALLLHLKESVIEMRNRVTLAAVKSATLSIIGLLKTTSKLGLFDTKVGIIDESFLLSVAAVQEQVPRRYLQSLKSLFRAHSSSPLFASHLLESDFPVPREKKGRHGGQIDRILGKALSQAAVAHILDRCDTAYAKGVMDIGLYSFAHLSFAVFCRPNSYRQIRMSDFNFDPKSSRYTIQIVTSKTREHNPSKTIFTLNEPLGILLTKQRQHVLATCGNLVAPEYIDQLALFPARKLINNNSLWSSDYANQSWGMYEASSKFISGYGSAVQRIIGDDSHALSANVLRHTVGTTLAQTGVSSKTIQAVLRHASDVICQAYVDIAFHGLIGELSEAMRPAFESHLPGLLNFRSQTDPLAEEKRIRTEDLDTGHIEDIGECGKSIACENAPIVCYGCFRFRPCWDADHGINLKIVQREIENMEKRGKPFQHMADRARTVKNRIVVVMNAADRYRDAMSQVAGR